MILLQGRTDLRTLADKVRDLWMDRGDIVIKCNIEDDRVSPDMIDVTIKQPKPSKWHRVEDELPYPGGQLCVMTDLYLQPIMAFYSRDGKWRSFPGQSEINVTHWRELPKPPKKAKEGNE